MANCRTLDARFVENRSIKPKASRPRWHPDPLGAFLRFRFEGALVNQGEEMGSQEFIESAPFFHQNDSISMS